MEQRNDNGTTRREMLALALAAAGGAVLAGGGTAIAAPGKPGLTTSADWLRAYMLMRGALDERLVIGFAKGRYYGVVGDEARILYGVVAATFARYRRRADGGYDGVSKEIAYFCDLSTGKVMDTFRNPYTNEDVTVQHAGYPAAQIVIDTDMKLHLAKPVPGMTMLDGIVDREVRGDNVFLAQETATALQAPGMAKPFRYAELVTMRASLTDLQRSGAKRVSTQNGWTSTVGWRPWLKMGDRPGHLSGMGHGAYGVALADLPPEWRDAVAERQPGVLKNPAGLLPAF